MPHKLGIYRLSSAIFGVFCHCSFWRSVYNTPSQNMKKSKKTEKNQQKVEKSRTFPHVSHTFEHTFARRMRF